MNIAEQMQAQIAFNKALPQIQSQLTTGSVAHVQYCDGLMPMLQDAGFDVQFNQYDRELVVKFKDKGGFWVDR